MPDYKLLGAGAKRRVAFSCPVCNADLECPLTDAGQVFPCPTCGRDFTVPGAEVIQREAEAAVALSQHRREAVDEQQRVAAAIRAEQAARAKQLEYERAHNVDRLASAGRLPPSQPVPEYQPIVTGARVLTFLVILCYVVGAAQIIVAAVVLLAAINQSVGDPTLLKAGALTLTISGLGAIVGGAIINMMAHISLAVRDIARSNVQNGNHLAAIARSVREQRAASPVVDD